MKRLAPWAWLVVLGTALALSWWSLDALGLHFGMPKLLAAMVSATFDGAALVAADLALRRTAVADSAVAVKLLMLTAVGLSAWLNEQHASLLGYPLVGRVLFAAPPVMAGWLFELQLRTLRRVRKHELGQVVQRLQSMGGAVWLFHPWAALRHLSRIAGSRLRSIPETVMDWESVSVSTQGWPDGLTEPFEHPAILGAPVEEDECTHEDAATGDIQQKAGRSPVPDELYLGKLRELIAEASGVVPSAREVARQLSIGQDRARRLIATLKDVPTDGTPPGAPS